MSETVEMYRDMKAHDRLVRQKFGVECPTCKEKRPKAHASILLPRQRCRVDGYVDPRPALTEEEWAGA